MFISLAGVAACSGGLCGTAEKAGEDGASAPTEAAEPVTVVDGARVFDGEEALGKRRVVIAGDSIEAVGTAAEIEIPERARVVSGEGKTLMPGLIDAHTHAFRRRHLEQALLFGVTTELDMLADPDRARELKEVSRGETVADLRSAGNAVTAPEGHGTQFVPGLDTLEDAENAADFVSRRVDEGSDYIKVIMEDFSAHGGSGPTLTEREVGAAIRAAHEHDKLAVVHVSKAEDARRAARLGADGLAHVWSDGPADDLAQTLADADVFVVPTLTVVTAGCEFAPAEELAGNDALRAYLDAESEGALEKASDVEGRACDAPFEDVSKLAEAGVDMVAGTDAHNSGAAHGISMHGELELLVRAGLSPGEALAAATSRTADAFDLPDRGRIAPEKRADLVLVRGNAIEDITATRNIAAVWKAGERLDREAILAERRKSEQDAADIAAGTISDFESGDTASAFGAGWETSSDRDMGGSSTAEARVVEGGPGNSAHALRVSGEVNSNPRGAWAGTTFIPGPSFMTPADLSEHDGLFLSLRGDGTSVTLMLFRPDNLRSPPSITVDAGDAWDEKTLSFEDFDGADGSDVSGIFIGATEAGPFRFEIDDVVLR